MTGSTEDRLASMFERTRAEGRPAVIIFAPCGFPERDATVEVIKAAVEGGADAIEIGMPFSDPLADGPVNQAAYGRALEEGFVPADVWDTVRRLRAEGVGVPILGMGYSNPLFAYGIEAFTRDAAEAGLDGFVIVDLPPEEAGELEQAARARGLHLIYLLAPTSTDERIALAAEHGSGFLYCVSVTGVTGTQEAPFADLPPFIERVRGLTDLPLAIGFGISRREHVEAAGRLADAAIIGSAFVARAGETPRDQRSDVLRTFVEGITGHGTE
ncbi:MAG: tryptophan synthase subunit alpha [Dehalococcoidia bacterium]